MFKFILLSCLYLAVYANLYCSDSYCSYCTQGFLYNYVSCLPMCPNGYDEDLSLYSCEEQDDTTVFKESFPSTTKWNTFETTYFMHPEGLTFDDPNKLSPIPTFDRGFYFEQTSRLVSINSFVPGPDFRIGLVVKIISDGTIVEIKDSTKTYAKAYLNNGILTFQILFTDENGQQSIFTYNQIFSGDYWDKHTFEIYQQLDYITIKISDDEFTINYQEFRCESTSVYFYIGGSTSGTSFNGFLYDLEYHNSDFNYPINDLLIECNYNQYYNSETSTCNDCDSSCSTWPSCISSNNCQVCFSQYCANCEGYGFSDCLSCSNSNTSPYCDIGYNCLTSSSGLLCSVCQSGFELIDGLCLNTPNPYDPLNLLSPIINIRFDEFSQYYSIFQSGTISSTYGPFNNTELDDPYPVKQRGLYLNFDTYLKSSILISLNYKFTILFWVLATNDGNLWTGTHFASFAETHMEIGLRSPSMYKKVISSEYVHYVSEWVYSAIVVDVTGDITTITPIADGSMYADTSLTGYLFYDDPNTVLIGVSADMTNNLIGFIYSLTLWQTAIYDFTGVINDINDLAYLWQCLLDQYYNDYEQKFMSCEIECTLGCATWGTCRQCLYPACDFCSNYDIPCDRITYTPCLINYHYTITDKCCHSECSDCYGPDYYRCLACENSRYLVGSVCADQCPVGAVVIGYTCITNNSPVINTVFDAIGSVQADGVSSVVFKMGSEDNEYPDFDSNDPTPALNRGYYFNESSYMTSSPFSISYNYTIDLFIKVLEHGTIMTKDQLSFSSEENAARFIISPEIDESFSPIPLNVWNVLALQGSSDIDGIYTYSFIKPPGTPETVIHPTSYAFRDSFSSLVLGKPLGSFKGFIWNLKIYNSVVDVSGLSITVCENSEEVNCLWDCGIDYYLEGSVCLPCESACVHGCRRIDDCNLCKESNCLKCSNFNDECVKCPSHSYYNNFECFCLEGYDYNESSGACERCEKKHLEHLCVDKCPIGYYELDNQCLVAYDDGRAIKYTFLIISGIYYDQVNFLSAMTGETAEFFYPNLENSDPIPAYLRGLYFTGNGSFISFPNPYYEQIVFGLRFYMVFWINPFKNSGYLLSKYNENMNELVGVKIENLKIKVVISIGDESFDVYSGNSLMFGNWNHLYVTVSYENGSYVSVAINKLQEPMHFIASDAFIDDYTMVFVGKSIGLEYFNGFLYSIETYVMPQSLDDMVEIVDCDNCLVCPITGICIPNCNITTYYSIITMECDPCQDFCSSIGCRNPNNCSLCFDPNCLNCTNYNKNSCMKCENSYVFQDHKCIPCAQLEFFDNQTQKCQSCEGLCVDCISKTQCISCKNNSSINNNKQCICDQGYDGINTCTRNTFSAMMTVDYNNIVYLHFTEKLQNSLSKENIDVTLNNKPINYTLSADEEKIYKIEVEFIKDVEEGSKLKVSFLADLVSSTNSLLPMNSIEILLFVYHFKQAIIAVETVKKYTKIGFYSVLGFLFGTSIITIDPNCFYTFLNSAELFSYVILFDVDLEPAVVVFLNSLRVNSNAPSITSYIYSKDKTNNLENQFKNFGYKTSLILVNSDFYMQLFAFLMILNVLIYFISFIPQALVKRLAKAVLDKFKYKIYIRYWIQTCMEITFNSLLGTTYHIFDTTFGIIDFILSFFMIIIQISMLVTIVLLIRKRALIEPNNKENFMKKFGEFFEEFRSDYTKNNIYYLLFYIRRLIICITALYIRIMFLQFSISLVVNLAILVHLFSTKCYIHIGIQIYTILIELCIFTFYTIITLSFFSQVISSPLLAVLCLTIVCAAIFITLFVSVIQVCIAIYKKCAKRFGKVHSEENAQKKNRNGNNLVENISMIKQGLGENIVKSNQLTPRNLSSIMWFDQVSSGREIKINSSEINSWRNEDKHLSSLIVDEHKAFNSWFSDDSDLKNKGKNNSFGSFLDMKDEGMIKADKANK
ncbi:hypothetical protein SteCoe_20141 [Stentor coeruleus]|uniref:TNFR-Cys domain-containing protein n=1 Tax=Stentor coeruleus TaxID=5963 RepID=A0A1R2BT45_9CILI|nr:hypothetical protein SteCoe_20141 [Stentor coeruleus]